MWNPEDYLTVYEQPADKADPGGLAPLFYQQACRQTLSAPGFALIQFSRHTNSQSLRRWMVALKQALAALHLEHAHIRRCS
jgi:hypothetical protein